jgi:hypothetical protein
MFCIFFTPENRNQNYKNKGILKEKVDAKKQRLLQNLQQPLNLLNSEK